MILLDLIDANDQLLEAELDGSAYYLGVSWNEAGQLWTISVRDLNKQVLVSGICAVPLYALLHQVRRSEMPPGELIVDCVPGTALNRSSFTDGSATLWYFDVDDMAELASA